MVLGAVGFFMHSIALLFAALFLLIVLGVVLFILVGVAERLILPWNHEARDD